MAIEMPIVVAWERRLLEAFPPNPNQFGGADLGLMGLDQGRQRQVHLQFVSLIAGSDRRIS
jgi:hypothetical protein